MRSPVSPHFSVLRLTALCRLGIALANPSLIQVLNNTKAPYNISTPTAHLAMAALSPDAIQVMRNKVATLTASRLSLMASLASLWNSLGIGLPIGANEANFILVPVLVAHELGSPKRPDNTRAQRVYKYLAEKSGVVVRYRGSEPGCEGCLRITVGTEEENEVVIRKLREVLSII